MSKIKEKFNELMRLPGETEVVEWKEAKFNFDFRELGKYFSALSNEANLKNKKSAWLIFGVKEDHTQFNPSLIFSSRFIILKNLSF